MAVVLPGFCKASPGPHGKFCFSIRNQVPLASRDLSKAQSFQGKKFETQEPGKPICRSGYLEYFSPLGQLNAGHFYCEDADFDDSDSSFFVLMNC